MKNRIRRQNRYFFIHDSEFTTVKLISGLFADVNKSFFENEEIKKKAKSKQSLCCAPYCLWKFIDLVNIMAIL